jgi:hypothetical protein
MRKSEKAKIGARRKVDGMGLRAEIMRLREEGVSIVDCRLRIGKR